MASAHTKISSRYLNYLPYTVLSLLYFLPIIAEQTTIPLDDRARILLIKLFTTPPVLLDFFLILGGHLTLFSGLLALTSMAASGLLKATSWAYSLCGSAACSLALVVVTSVNSALFPNSVYTLFYGTGFHELTAPVAIAVFLLLVACGLLHKQDSLRFIKLAVATPLIATTYLSIAPSFSAGSMSSTASAQLDAKHNRPHVILLGIDSLGATTLESHGDFLPNISKLHSASYRPKLAVTPLPRTCPAWISALTGKLPGQHLGVFNLTPTSTIDQTQTAPYLYREGGYHTVLALDERRFCNIDTSFGFASVVGPKRSGLDFIVHRYMDTPLTNIALQTPVAAWLFPISHMNVASYANYDEDAIVEKIEIAVRDRGNRPVFLATHLESGHFPYKTRYQEEKPKGENVFFQRHIAALQVADRQVGMLLDVLKRARVLDNAIVILFSDHGESFGNRQASIKEEFGVETLSPYGHGTEILSRTQTDVPLGFIRYRDGETHSRPKILEGTYSLRDIHGVLRMALSGHELALPPLRDCVYMESGIRFSAAEDYKDFDEAALARQAASYYRVTAAGVLELRRSRLLELVANKDFALKCESKVAFTRAPDPEIYTAIASASLPTLYEVVEGSSELEVALLDYIQGTINNTASVSSGDSMFSDSTGKNWRTPGELSTAHTIIHSARHADN